MENQTWATSIGMVRDLKSFDSEGWRRFVHLYTPLVYAWCRRANLQQADAADVCQDVFGDVSRGIKKLQYDQPSHSFRGWLWTISRAAIARHYRAAAKQPRAVGGEDSANKLAAIPDWVNDDQIPEAPTGEAEVIRRAANLVRGDFEEKTWKAFWLSVVDELPGKEIAEQLEMNQNAVRQAKFRVMKRLREFVGFD